MHTAEPLAGPEPSFAEDETATAKLKKCELSDTD
jgi:hypothetical protein